MRGKPKKTAQKPSATAVAAAAKCSRQLAARLLKRGFTEREIVQRIQENKAREEAGVARANGHDSGPVNGFPVMPVPPFAHSEARKEHALAELRTLQVMREKGELLAREPWRSITVTILAFQRDLLWRLPGEAAQELVMRTAEEVTLIIRRHVEAIFHASESLFEGECKKYGLRLPPEPPPRPLPTQLPYYQQYKLASRTGELENITAPQEIGTSEWLALHPSISFQESFRYSRLKKQWDSDMADLLNRRSEWDLPAEVAPPPEPPEEPQVA